MTDEKPVILCIDDDPDILFFLQTILESAGLAYAGAATAEEGLRIFDKTAPTLVIVDLMMEEVDAGTNFARELRARGHKVPIFMLSSVGDQLSAVTDYTSLGLAGVFQKPLAKAHLLSVLQAKLADL